MAPSSLATRPRFTDWRFRFSFRRYHRAAVCPGV